MCPRDFCECIDLSTSILDAKQSSDLTAFLKDYRQMLMCIQIPIFVFLSQDFFNNGLFLPVILITLQLYIYPRKWNLFVARMFSSLNKPRSFLMAYGTYVFLMVKASNVDFLAQ